MPKTVQDKRIADILHNLRHRQLTDDEWHHLEVLASDDPFLADALAGLRAVPPDEIRGHLHSIALELKQKGRNRRGMVFRYSAAAATILVVLAAAVWLILDTGEAPTVGMDSAGGEQTQFENPSATSPPLTAMRSDTQKALNSLQSPETITTPPHPSAHGQPSLTDTESPATSTRRQEAAQKPSPARTEGVDSDARQQISEASKGTAEQEYDTEPAMQRPATDGIGLQAPALAQSEALRDVTSRQGSQIIAGTVLDYTGEPLIGANVLLGNTEHGTVTDFDGRFSLDLPRELQMSGDTNRLIVSYTGYQTLDTAVVPGNDVRILLPDAGVALNEVVVTGNDKSRRNQFSGHTSGSRAFARPADGEKAYRRYIRKNLKYPPQAAEAGVHGDVTLEFTLDKDGVPDEIKVLQSLGYGCDEEAIRLIREGPKWDVGAAQVPVARYTVEF